MKKLIKYDYFKINERYHVSQDVKHLTNLIYNKIYQLVPNLILKKEIIIENLYDSSKKTQKSLASVMNLTKNNSILNILLMRKLKREMIKLMK